jgi:hypothetical protein
MTHLMNNSETVANLVQHLTQSNTIVRRIHECEPKESVLKFPLPWCLFFNPMSSDSEVSIRVGHLPCVAGEADLPTDHLALNEV